MADRGAEPTRARGVVLLSVIFLLGMIIGAAAYYLGQRSVSPPDSRLPGPPMQHFFRELDLDPEQHRKIREIFHQNRIRFDEILEESHDQIHDLLTPEQRERLENLRPPRHGGRRGPGPGGGRGRGRGRYGPPPRHGGPMEPPPPPLADPSPPSPEDS